MALVKTTRGDIDDSQLLRKEGVEDTDTETVRWVEYWLDGELVHRSVQMQLKQSVFVGSVAAEIV